MKDDFYNQWLAQRRQELPPTNLADEIMKRVGELEQHQQATRWLRLVHRVEHSRAGRWAACGGALAVGSLPFLFLAYVAQFVTF
jgi:hypothetical protein